MGLMHFALVVALLSLSRAFSDPDTCSGSPVVGEYLTRQQAEAAGGQLSWTPEKDKYLLMHCVRGQISNRVRCIHYHLLLAGLLNRSLLVPLDAHESSRGYDLRIVFDTVHARHCYGHAVLTTREYVRRHRRTPLVDRIVCWQGPQGACGGDQQAGDPNCPLHLALGRAGAQTGGRGEGVVGDVLAGGDSSGLALDAEQGLGVIRDRFVHQRLGFAESLALGAACLDLASTQEEVLRAFLQPQVQRSHVLVVGDLVEVDVFSSSWRGAANAVIDKAGRALASPAWRPLPFTRTAHCPSRVAVQADGAILHGARAYVQTQFQGRPFVAVHWRRGDFKAYCFWHGPPRACFFPPKQVAWFIARTLGRLEIFDVHLATNGRLEEVNELLSHLDKFTDGEARVARLPALSRSVSWMEPVYARRMNRHLGLVSIALEKAVCTLAAVFLGSPASTFSQDIQRLRIDLDTYHCNDTTVCLGEEEWIRNKG